MRKDGSLTVAWKAKYSSVHELVFYCYSLAGRTFIVHQKRLCLVTQLYWLYRRCCSTFCSGNKLQIFVLVNVKKSEGSLTIDNSKPTGLPSVVTKYVSSVGWNFTYWNNEIWNLFHSPSHGPYNLLVSDLRDGNNNCKPYFPFLVFTKTCGHILRSFYCSNWKISVACMF